MADERTTTVRAAGLVLRVLAETGVSFVEVGQRIGVDPGVFADQDARLPCSVVGPLWAIAEEKTGDPNIGMRVAQTADRSSFDAFSFIACASATYADAVDNVRRYMRLLNNGAVFDLEADEETAWLAWRSVTPNIAAVRHDSECVMAMCVTYSRLWLGDFDPLEVHFRHQAPPDISELETFFQAPLRYGSTECALRFASSELTRPVQSADPGLMALLKQYADETLAALPEPGRQALEVRSLIVKGLASGDIALTGIAKKLGLSERSLQRHLRDEGTSHKQLVEDTRRELAVRYLGNHSVSASEVAYMLGYSETAPFFRAFKKWTGQTPGQFRQA